MKQVIIVIICFLSISSFCIKAQEVNIKEGAYRNIVDFHNNKPFIKDVKFKLAPVDIGGFYSLETKGKIYTKRELRTQIWAIYQDSILYINLKRLGMGSDFSEIILLGRYSFFRGRVKRTAAAKQYITEQFYLSGLFGLLLADYQIVKNMDWNSLFVLDLQKGIPDNLNKEHMTMILQKDKDLLHQYLDDPHKDNINTMLFYLSTLNSKIPLF